MKKICVLGLGYIGLPTAVMFANHGVQVVGVDINEAVLATLRSGQLHIHEPGLPELVKTALQSGRLEISNRPQTADAFIIAVPTPFYGDKKADMRAVIAAAEAIVPYLQPGNLVVLESTSPPLTTTNMVRPILERSGLAAGSDFHLAYSPERVLPGKILQELVENARVVGGIDPDSAKASRDLYAVFVTGQIILTDATTAEMVKLMENTYRDVNIAIANEFSRLADRFGVNIWEAICIANLHPRVHILQPGPGVGGHCISVDPWFLVEAAPDLASLILAARLVNDSQPHFVVELVKRAAGSLSGKRVAVLGLAYKPEVDDLRESPAVETARLLVQAGARVVAYEPYKPTASFAGFETVTSLEMALKGADVLLPLVAHQQFRSLPPQDAARWMAGRTVVDVLDLLPVPVWQAAGFQMAGFVSRHER